MGIYDGVIQITVELKIETIFSLGNIIVHIIRLSFSVMRDFKCSIIYFGLAAVNKVVSGLFLSYFLKTRRMKNGP